NRSYGGRAGRQFANGFGYLSSDPRKAPFQPFADGGLGPPKPDCQTLGKGGWPSVWPTRSASRASDSPSESATTDTQPTPLAICAPGPAADKTTPGQRSFHSGSRPGVHGAPATSSAFSRARRSPSINSRSFASSWANCCDATAYSSSCVFVG